jgi:hypothetical protein
MPTPDAAARRRSRRLDGTGAAGRSRGLYSDEVRCGLDGNELFEPPGKTLGVGVLRLVEADEAGPAGLSRDPLRRTDGLGKGARVIESSADNIGKSDIGVPGLELVQSGGVRG